MHDATFDPGSSSETFRCNVVIEPSRVRIVLAGELDMATAPRLAETLRGLDTDRARVVIDLRRLSFIDSSGLKLLLRCNEAARRRSLRFGLIPGPRAVQRIFEITGTLGLFEFDSPLPQPSARKRSRGDHRSCATQHR